MNESLVAQLAQPDQRSCGASVLVAAHMLLDPAYADEVAATDRSAGFATHALAMHRRIAALVGAHGGLQVPWPRLLGTAPWAVAREMSALSGPGLPAVGYDVHPVLGDRSRIVARMASVCTAGRPVPFYVGDRWIPRHVVLAIAAAPDGLRVYNPAGGRITTVRTSDFVASALPFGRWRKPWFVVVPDLPDSP